MICFRLKVETLIIPFRLIPLFLCFNLVQSPILQTKKVYVLPGTFFYWSNPTLGEKYIRIALARDSDNFAQGMKLLREGLDILQLEKTICKT
jgi:hypothetical protein